MRQQQHHLYPGKPGRDPRQKSQESSPYYGRILQGLRLYLDTGNGKAKEKKDFLMDPRLDLHLPGPAHDPDASKERTEASDQIWCDRCSLDHLSDPGFGEPREQQKTDEHRNHPSVCPI